MLLLCMCYKLYHCITITLSGVNFYDLERIQELPDSKFEIL